MEGKERGLGRLICGEWREPAMAAMIAATAAWHAHGKICIATNGNLPITSS
jgi:hypothetical protein